MAGGHVEEGLDPHVGLRLAVPPVDQVEIALAVDAGHAVLGEVAAPGRDGVVAGAVFAQVSRQRVVVADPVEP